MIPFDKLGVAERQVVKRACTFLFSPEEAGNMSFLSNLTPKDVKTAFRRKAKMYHPDLYRKESHFLLEKRQERFLKIQHSYETLVGVFPKEQKETTFRCHGKTKKIIAIGGAKGGIGKTMFAANLAIILSQMGKKTIVADVDLGGANLHLYLGETRIKKNLNDFLNKQSETLEDVMIQSKYGPLIIGGDSSRLGASNIHFSKKVRLMNAIRSTDADYVVLDLGGDTSYNMIDFFNMSDIQIVMTTCEPASYLDAYNFIKVSLFRKLTRIYGNETDSRQKKDEKLVALIKESLVDNGDKHAGTIKSLMEQVAAHCPEKKPVIHQCLNSYKPLLLINKSDETPEAGVVAKRVKDVAGKMLSIQVEAVAPVLYNDKTELSSKDLIPVTIKRNNGYMANRIRTFVEKTIM